MCQKNAPSANKIQEKHNLQTKNREEILLESAESIRTTVGIVYTISEADLNTFI
jgi:hypothetical protein